MITLDGKTIARIVLDRKENEREVALKRLDEFRGTVIAEEWAADADNL